MPTNDVIVNGGGHAGCEAANVSGRLGAGTLLVGGFLARVAQMLRGERVEGAVCADGSEFHARCVVLTAGTFLRGSVKMGGIEPFRPVGWMGGRWTSERSAGRRARMGRVGPEVRQVVAAALSEAAIQVWVISSLGRPYCPSIEDKVLKFPDAERHQVFLQAEALETSELYVNGVSTSLPLNVQRRFLAWATWVPARDQAYLGVLVDELATRGVDEP